jgi:hypothetical protein
MISTDFAKNNKDKLKQYIKALTHFCTSNNETFKKKIDKLTKNEIYDIITSINKTFTILPSQSDEFKFNKIIEYPEKQQKIVKRRFKEKAITKKLITDNPTIRVLKKYSRFDKEAKAKGFLKNPVSDEDDKFEVYDVSSSGFMSDLSPMLLGPIIDTNGDILGYNIEDVWQSFKVFSIHMNGGKFDKKAQNEWKNGSKRNDDNWIKEWTKWSENGRFSGEGKRHRCKIDKKDKCINPNIPLFSYFHDQKLSYVEARKQMYIPWYAKLVKNTRSFQYLKKRFDSGISLILLDPDGQPRDEEIIYINEDNMRERVNNKNKIFGHGFVLACVLMGINVWNE